MIRQEERDITTIIMNTATVAHFLRLFSIFALSPWYTFNWCAAIVASFHRTDTDRQTKRLGKKVKREKIRILYEPWYVSFGVYAHHKFRSHRGHLHAILPLSNTKRKSLFYLCLFALHNNGTG